MIAQPPATAAPSPSGDVLQAAYGETYRAAIPDVVKFLKQYLGRPLIAHMVGIEDANTVSRWSSGKVVPERASGERLRTIATVFLALANITGSPETAAHWFTGANPDLGDRMAADEIRDHHDSAVFAAVRALAQT